MRRSLLVGLVPALAFAAASLASTKEAAAGPYLGVDLDLGTAFANSRVGGSNVDFSYGLGGRVGYKFEIPRSYVWILPEAGIHYMSFGTNALNAGAIDHATTFNVGGRFGLKGLVQPNVFAHLGYGVLGSSLGGPAADIGAGIDFKLGRVFTLGAQIAYNTVTVTDTPFGAYTAQGSAKWVNFGLVSGFNFGAPPARRTYYYR